MEGLCMTGDSNIAAVRLCVEPSATALLIYVKLTEGKKSITISSEV